MSLILINTTTVFANSSWHWLTMSPVTLLPLAVILTLFTEITIIKKWNRELDLKKICEIIFAANLASFLVPFIERAIRFSPTTGGFSFVSANIKGPFFIVLIGYLLITLLVEIPLVLIYLRKNTDNIKRLFMSVLLVNILTTGMVALIERLLCKGVW
jgi:hypothetical protein